MVYVILVPGAEPRDQTRGWRLAIALLLFVLTLLVIALLLE